jgi:hypothetical protein
VKNVTPPPPPGPRAVTTPTPRSRQNQLIILAVFVIVLVLLVRACQGHENHYEHIAHEFTQALQNNDYNAAVKFQNSETAAQMGHGRLGTAADRLAPLGRIRRVKEDTPPNAGERVHEFEVQFQNGTVHEKIKFDPQDKIYRFDYNKVSK